MTYSEWKKAQKDGNTKSTKSKDSENSVSSDNTVSSYKEWKSNLTKNNKRISDINELNNLVSSYQDSYNKTVSNFDNRFKKNEYRADTQDFSNSFSSYRKTQQQKADRIFSLVNQYKSDLGDEYTSNVKNMLTDTLKSYRAYSDIAQKDVDYFSNFKDKDEYDVYNLSDKDLQKEYDTNNEFANKVYNSIGGIVSSITKKDIPSTNRAKYVENEVERRKQVRDEEREIKYSGKTYSDVIKGYDKADEETKSWIDENKYNYMTIDELKAEKERLESEKKKNGSGIVNFIAAANSGQEKFLDAAEKGYDYEHKIEIVNSALLNKEAENISKIDSDTLALIDKYNSAKTKVKSSVVNSGNSNSGNNIANYNNEVSYDDEKERLDILSKLENKINPETGKNYTSEEIYHIAELRDYQISKENTEDIVKGAETLAEKYPLASALGSRVLYYGGGLTGAGEGAIQLVEKALGQRENINAYSQAFSSTRASNQIDTTIMENHDFNIGNIDLFDFGYQTVTSVADNLIRAGLSAGSGGLAGAMMSAEVFSQSIIDGKDKGYSDAKAITNSVLQAVVEGLTEKYSLEKILEAKDAKHIWSAVAKSFAAEGSEEVVSNWANRIIDVIQNGQYNEVSQQIASNMLSGMSETNAIVDALLNVVGDDLEAGLIGGLSGALMGGGVYVGEAENSLKNKAVKGYLNQKETKAYKNSLVAGDEVTQKLAEGTDSYQAYKEAYDKYQSDNSKENLKGLKKASKETAKNIKQNVDTKTKTTFNTVLYNELNSEGNTVTDDEYMSAQKWANGDMLTEYDRSNIENLGEEKVRGAIEKAYEQQREKAYEIKDNASSAVIEERENAYKDLLKEGAKIKTTKDKKGIVESVYLAVDDNTNNDVEVSPASKMYSDIKLLSELGSTDDTLNSINAVANESGADFNDLAIKNRMSILGQDVDLTSSVNYSNAEDYLKQTAKNRVVAQKTLETGLDISEVGKDVYKSLSKKARLNLRFADKLSKVFGNKVVVFVSTLVEDENGKKTYVVPDNIAEKINVAKGEQSPYGAYSGKDGAIYLDINGKGSQKDWYVYSLSHEYTHAIAQNASDKFEDLAAFVFKEMGYDNVERLIRKKQDTQHIDLATAREEVVADACEEMLLSDDFIDHFNNLYSENKGLAQKLLRMLKKTWLSLKTLVNSMDEAYLSEEAKLMRQSTNEAKKLFAQKYAEALKVASGNYQASETLGENKTSLQGRDFEEEIARYSLGDNYESVDNSKGELEIAYNNTDVMYSERTWETGGKDQMIQYLKDNGYSESDISDFVSAIDNRIEGLHALAEKYANLSFPQFLDHLNKDIVTDIRTGKRTIFSFVSNGDYPVNIDTMLNCKKRIQYGKVLSRLAKSGVLGKIRFQSEAIALVNKILAQNGFETACHACFVEARRQQLQAWAETIVIEYNERVDQVIKQYNKTHKDKLTEGYLFTDNGNAVSDDDLIYAIGKLSEEGKTEDGSVIMSKNEGGGSAKTVYDKAFNLISADPKIFAKKLKVSDLLTAEGIEQVKRFSPEIFSLVKSRYGAASPKIIQDFNAYQNEILDLSFTTISKMTGNSVKGNLDITRSVKQRFKKEFTEKAKEIVAKQYPEINNAKERKKMVTTVYNQMIARQSMREYLFSIGGARIQSFSDFMIENVLDYIQIFTDMTLQKLPMHGYTKEMACLRLFGMSGAKWNGSWIAHTEESLGKEMAGLLPYTEENAKHGITVEVDGTKYVIQFDDFERNQLAKKNKDLFPNGDFIQSIGYKDLVSLMLDPRYSANVGSITIGFSDLQIRAMLNSPLFRMVIPYHKSGMSPLFAHLMGVSKYNDYSDFQTTRVARVRNAKTGEVYEYKKNKDGHFVIIDGKEHKISVDTSFAFDEDLQRTGDAKTTADNYLAFCKAPKTITVNGIEVEYTLHPEFNGVNEKGEQVGYDFTQEDNYYKLLENFNTYDSLQEITKGKKVPAPQGVVSMAYAGESKSTTLTEAQLEQYRKDLESVGLYTEDEINKYVEKAKRNFTQIIESELASRNAIAAELNPKEEFTYQTIENELLNNFSREGRMATNIADYLEGKEVVNKILGKNLTDKYSFNDRSKDANKISQLTPKGTYLQARDTEGNTLTESQQEYFKDSKVRDENGALKIVYHGTPNGGFTVFDKSKLGSLSKKINSKLGFYFVDEEFYAQSMANSPANENSKVYKSYLNITNPIIVSNTETLTDKEIADIEKKIATGKYDGIVDDIGVYVAFEPNQIKNIDNLNPTSNDDIRYSYGGRLSETADESNLNSAIEMESKGIESEKIRKKTGWFRGYDGKWRYEIDDSKAEWNIDNAEYDKRRYFDFGERIYKLSDILHHKELYKAYPQLKNATVLVNNYSRISGYVLAGSTDSIVIRDLSNNFITKMVLIHEVQHLIQEIEGFAKGSNADMFTQIEWGEKQYSAYEKCVEIAKKLYNIIKRNGGTIDKEYDIGHNEIFFNEVDKNINDNFELLRSLSNSNPRTEKLFDEYYKNYNTIYFTTPEGQYHSTAGEIESFDTQARMNLTEEQRKNIRPNIDREDVVFAFEENNSVNYQSREFAKEIQKEFNTSESVDTIVSTLESMRDIFFSDEYDYQEKKELIKYSAETLAYSALKKETVNDNEIVEYLEKRFRSKRKNKLVNFEENGIRLTAEQKAEIKGNYSSLREYQSKLLKHGIVLNEKGETLNDVWGELNEDYPSIFKSDTSDVDMPYIFEQALNPERSRSEEEFKYAVDSFVERLTSWVEDNPPEVPSFGEFRVDYSDPNLSQRDILATALMNAAADEGDFKIIQKYQENISDANRYERKLQRNKERLRDSFKKKKGLTAEERKALVEENKELNEKIRRIDSQLLKLSSTSSLKGYVENERKLADKKSNERSMAKTKLKQEIIRTSKWITYPTKSQTPCPDFLKEPISKVLRALGEGTNNKDLAIALGNLNLKIESLKEAQDGEDGFNGYLDLPIDFTKELASLSKQVADMSEYSADKAKAIKDLTPNQAQKFELAIKQLRHSAENVNKLHQNKVFESAIKAGESTMKFLDDIALKVSDKDSTSYKILMNMKDKAGKFLAWENALPEYVFNRFGEGGKSIFEEFKDSQDELARKTKIILDFTESVDGWNAKNIKKWETEKHEVELENGNKLTLTTANIMSIFGLARREQGVQHLLGGGVHVVYGKNNGETSDSILTINDLQKINDILTDEQRDIVIKAQKFFQTTGKWGNEISQKRFLVDMNTEKTYFPIETSDTTRADKDPQKSQMDMFRLLNISATKPLTPGANNQLVIRSFFEVFANHTADMAKMSSFGMSLLDFMKWFNYSNKNTFVGSDQNTKIEVKGVRKSMNKAFGENKTAVNYCREFIRDINGRSGSTSITEGIWSKFVRNTKVASVAANLRVAFLQPTAYLRAVKILSPASLTKGLSGVKNLRTYMKLAEKYCPMAYWKSLGFYETDINRGLESMIKGEESAKDKVLEKAMLGAEYGDKITWAVLFKACCYEVSKNGLTIGSEENYKAAGKLMRDVIYQTQVVDSTLTRSQAMRSKSTAMKVITAFMSEPTLSYNILLDSYEKINIDSRKYGKKEAWNRNKKYVSRSLVTYAITAIAAAIVEGLFDSWRDDDDEKFFEKFPQNFLENLIGDVSVLNKIPIFKDGFSLAMKMFGIGYYKESGLDNQVLADINNAYEIIKDDGYTFYGKWVKPITRILSDLSGVPAFAALREVVSVWNNIAPAIWGDTAKIISYNRNTTSMANVYLDALESGKNIDRALKQFEDNEKVQSGDKTVEEVANTYLKAYIGTQYKEGNMSKDKATEYLEKYVGMSDNDIYWAFDRWDSDSETYSKYEDLIEAVENGNVSSVISKYVDNTELKDGENQAEKKKRVLTAMRQSIASEYKNKYKNMSNAERVKIQRKLIDAYVACGMTRQDALEKINDWTK